PGHFWQGVTTSIPHRSRHRHYSGRPNVLLIIEVNEISLCVYSAAIIIADSPQPFCPLHLHRRHFVRYSQTLIWRCIPSSLTESSLIKCLLRSGRVSTTP